MALKRYELPEPTGVFTTCKICGQTKDDAEFKWSKGKRAGLVCRECDRAKKAIQYAEDTEHRERVKAKSRKYELENPEKVREAKRAYREGNELLKAKKRAYQQANKDKENARCTAWYLSHRDDPEFKAKIRDYNERTKEERSIAQRRYYELNKEEILARNALWRASNRGLSQHYFRMYNLSKQMRTPAWADVNAIAQIYKNRPDGCEVDHIIPLHGKLVSGLHVENNLQYLTEFENMSKSNKFDPDTFVGP